MSIDKKNTWEFYQKKTKENEMIKKVESYKIKLCNMNNVLEELNKEIIQKNKKIKDIKLAIINLQENLEVKESM